MAKHVINYEHFTHAREKLLAIRKKEMRKKRMKQMVLVIILLFIILILNVIQQSQCDYYVYKEETKTEENSGVSYETFGSGFIKYSSNGIEYQKRYGLAAWNVAISFSRPVIAKTSSYIIIGDQGGNKAILFNEDGKVYEYTMKYPIVQMSVAENGSIVAILQGDNCNYIQVYTEEGDMIAEIKASLSETGYPLAAAISPDGAQLAVSFYNIENLTAKSRIVFYDFSQQIQADSIPLKGGFDYEDNLIPKLYFFDSNKLIAVGNRSTYFYDISDDPKQNKQIKFSETIESIFISDRYFGYVCENENPEKEGRYHLFLYNTKGKKKMDTILDMNYQDIYMVDQEIVATKDNEVTIINSKGHILFQGQLEGSRIEKVLPCFGWRTYRVVFNNKIVKMRLSFFDPN